jgi:hypothetical protein
MKSKARRQIEKWVKTGLREPVYIAQGLVFMMPSRSRDHNLVTWLQRPLPSGRISEEWACSCEAWFYNEHDDCPHIREIKRQIEEARGVD